MKCEYEFGIFCEDGMKRVYGSALIAGGFLGLYVSKLLRTLNFFELLKLSTTVVEIFFFGCMAMLSIGFLMRFVADREQLSLILSAFFAVALLACAFVGGYTVFTEKHYYDLFCELFGVTLGLLLAEIVHYLCLLLFALQMRKQHPLIARMLGGAFLWLALSLLPVSSLSEQGFLVPLVSFVIWIFANTMPAVAAIVALRGDLSECKKH